jgi:hypothetical protein
MLYDLANIWSFQPTFMGFQSKFIQVVHWMMFNTSEAEGRREPTQHGVQERRWFVLCWTVLYRLPCRTVPPAWAMVYWAARFCQSKLLLLVVYSFTKCTQNITITKISKKGGDRLSMAVPCVIPPENLSYKLCSAWKDISLTSNRLNMEGTSYIMTRLENRGGLPPWK